MADNNSGYAVGQWGTVVKTTNGGVPPPFYSVSGSVHYEDNMQPVTSGYVKALKYTQSTGLIITLDSAQIQPNGDYILVHVPQDSLDVMAFENDEEDLSFVPTYYPSTIYWENATLLYPTGNLTNVNIGVYRITNPGGTFHVGGNIYTSNENNRGSLKDAIIYSKSGNVFKGYSISLTGGSYRIDSLYPASYEIICNRMGFYSAIRPITITTYSIDTLDFVLSTLMVKIENEGNILPEKFILEQNYPNPFNPETKIRFSLPLPSEGGAMDVSLKIFDVLGREAAVLVNELLKPGTYEVTWNASNYPSGIYFYKLQAGDYFNTKKMVLIR